MRRSLVGGKSTVFMVVIGTNSRLNEGQSKLALSLAERERIIQTKNGWKALLTFQPLR